MRRVAAAIAPVALVPAVASAIPASRPIPIRTAVALLLVLTVGMVGFRIDGVVHRGAGRVLVMFSMRPRR